VLAGWRVEMMGCELADLMAELKVEVKVEMKATRKAENWVFETAD
jgi:hypothetical protein